MELLAEHGTAQNSFKQNLSTLALLFGIPQLKCIEHWFCVVFSFLFVWAWPKSFVASVASVASVAIAFAARMLRFVVLINCHTFLVDRAGGLRRIAELVANVLPDFGKSRPGSVQILAEHKSLWGRVASEKFVLGSCSRVLPPFVLERKEVACLHFLKRVLQLKCFSLHLAAGSILLQSTSSSRMWRQGRAALSRQQVASDTWRQFNLEGFEHPGEADSRSGPQSSTSLASRGLGWLRWNWLLARVFAVAWSHESMHESNHMQYPHGPRLPPCERKWVKPCHNNYPLLRCLMWSGRDVVFLIVVACQTLITQDSLAPLNWMRKSTDHYSNRWGFIVVLKTG